MYYFQMIFFINHIFFIYYFSNDNVMSRQYYKVLDLVCIKVKPIIFFAKDVFMNVNLHHKFFIALNCHPTTTTIFVIFFARIMQLLLFHYEEVLLF